MAVFGGRLHRVDQDARKLRVTGQRHGPSDVVVKATGASQVRQDRLVAQTIHVRLTMSARQRANLMGRALLGHRVTRRDGVARLVDAQLVLRERQRTATALGVVAGHDGLATKRVNQVKGDFIASALSQVHRANDGHGFGRLLANRAFSIGLLRHLARQPVQRSVALHVRSKKTGRLYDDSLLRSIRDIRCHGEAPSVGLAPLHSGAWFQ